MEQFGRVSIEPSVTTLDHWPSGLLSLPSFNLFASSWSTRRYQSFPIFGKYQMEKMGASQNKCTKCILNCLSCVMACFERFIRFLTRNAYIQIALTGKSFCPAAKDAFETIWANTARYSLVGGIGGAFLLVSFSYL